MAEQSYPARQSARRAHRIARARHNLARAASESPSREARHGQRSPLPITVSLSLVTLCHVGAAYAACSSSVSAKTSHPERVQVRLVEPAPLPPVPEEEELAEAPRPERAPQPRAEKVVRNMRKEVTAEKPKSAPAQPVEIVGLTLESTSADGAGPAFAVGSTLAGDTARVANAPREAPVPTAPRMPGLPSASSNRRVAPRAGAGVKVEPARRLSRVEPEYPALLEHQGVEADVTVRVYITEEGLLERVELIRGASEKAFDQSALEAAKKERFVPETHDGTPVATALTYTYRFRITP